MYLSTFRTTLNKYPLNDVEENETSRNPIEPSCVNEPGVVKLSSDSRISWIVYAMDGLTLSLIIKLLKTTDRLKNS